MRRKIYRAEHKEEAIEKGKAWREDNKEKYENKKKQFYKKIDVL